MKHVVLLGAGYAHLAVLRNFGLRPAEGIRLTLVSRHRQTAYSGMLSGLIAGDYAFDDIHVDAAQLSQFAGAQFMQDEGVGLDLAQRCVICRASPPIAYDLLSIDIGSGSDTEQTPGATAHAIPVKPVDDFLGRFDGLLARTLARRARTRVAVVGAGASGVELLLAIGRRLQREAAREGFDTDALSLTLISATNDILPDFPGAFRDRFRALLATRRMSVVVGAAVTGVEPGRLLFAERPPIEADEILWATQAAPADWLAATGLPVDPHGFVQVDRTLRVVGQDNVFAAGDVASFAPHSLPKSGVYAVRAGPVLADNLRRALSGRRLRPFRPQRDALYLVATGDRRAIGTRNGLAFGGAWAWRWKDWIDRRFMRRFKDLPRRDGAATSSA